MRRLNLWVILVLMCVTSMLNAKTEKVFATFENPSNTNTTWDAATRTFTWSTTYYNQLHNIGLPNGDITKFKKLVVDCDIKSGEQFRILFYKDGSNLTLYAKDGVNEFIIKDELESVAPDIYNNYLSQCDEICISGNNRIAPGEVVINSIYLESYFEECIDLTPDMFFHWDSATMPTTCSPVECIYELNESTGIPYGDSSVNYLNYADLSHYSKLVVEVTDGTPRFLFNRDVDLGMFNSDESLSHLLEYPKYGTWTDRYFKTETNEVGIVYTVDVRQIVMDKGYCHLHAIKGANWTNVTVTKMCLYEEEYDVIDLQEWQLLKNAYANMDEGREWIRKWDFSNDNVTTEGLPGVVVENGHIIEINLRNNNLTGNFPYSFLSLPYLKKLVLSGNQLSGDIGISAYAFARMNPTMMTTLQELNISGNQFTGNIGLFANCFPALTSLKASKNCLEDVYPMIPVTVTTLDLSHQTISRVVPLHLAKLSLSDIATKVPTILLYDHTNQTFTPNINLMCTTSDNSWGMMMTYQNGQLAVPYVSNQNTYYGETGDTLNVSVYNNNGVPEGSTFRISLSFDEGDGNFDGQVNVLDLQTTILYIMEKYFTRPYNFTAANLWKDNLINVQDVICLVNQLMAAEQEQAQIANARRYAPSFVSSGDASIYLQDGKLMLNSIRPVAAFDMILNGTNSLRIANDLERMGITFVTKKQADNIHVIAYSMNGASIPSGTTIIGTVDSNAATVSHVMLSDSEANAITVSYSGTSTGIESIICSPTNDGHAIYDLQGRKVNATSHKGLYIKNGHKIIK